jgi:predicted  nucleic acid-binding Zn-ribbon protein
LAQKLVDKQRQIDDVKHQLSEAKEEIGDLNRKLDAATSALDMVKQPHNYLISGIHHCFDSLFR